jgi:hypothetical protein
VYEKGTCYVLQVNLGRECHLISTLSILKKKKKKETILDQLHDSKWDKGCHL